MTENVLNHKPLISTDQRVGLLLVLVIAVEAAVLLGVFRYGRADLWGDEFDYHSIASNLLHDHTYSRSMEAPLDSTALKPPGYPFMVAAIYAVTGDSRPAVRGFQFIFLTSTVFLTYAIALHFGPRVEATLAGVLCATYLPFLGITLRILTEALLMFLVVLLVYLLVLTRERQDASLKLHGLIGIVLAVAMLTHASYAGLVVMVAAVALWGARGWMQRLQRLLVLVAPAVLLLTPWAIRNVIALHAFKPLAASGGGSLLLSARQYAGPVDPRTMYAHGWFPVTEEDAQAVAVARAAIPQRSGEDRGLQSEMAADNELKRRAVRVFRGIQLRQLFYTVPCRILYFWGPGDIGPWYLTRVHRVAQIQYLTLFPWVVIGCCAAARKVRTYWPVWLPIAYVICVHSIYHVEARYSLPVRPFLLMFAAYPLGQVARHCLRLTKGLLHQ